jgi:histidinol-phosphatase
VQQEQEERRIFLDTAISAAKAAEAVILQDYSSPLQFSRKPDGTSVTPTDKYAERMIITAIRKRFLDHSILGEETGAETKQTAYTWIIDPIDGTKNYIRHIPLFSTQIALLEGDQLVLGVSNAPALGELMYAERGRGAFLNGKNIHVSATDMLEEAYVGLSSVKSFHKAGLLTQLGAFSSRVDSTRNFDFWGYHMLAQGKIDCYVGVGVNIWDIAALSAIIQEAGGKVTDLEGKPLSLATRSIVATNGKLHQAVLQHFSKPS